MHAPDGGERSRGVPDTAGDEGGDEHIIGEGERILRRGEPGEVRDEDGVARADAGKERCGRLWAEQDTVSTNAKRKKLHKSLTARPKAVVARSMRMGIIQT